MSKENKIEFKRLEFPEVSDIDIAFGGYPKQWFSSVMKIEEEKGDGKWNDLAENLFFNGGKPPINTRLPKEYLINGLRILRAVMGSFEPKHEHKEKVCGLILKSICS